MTLVKEIYIDKYEIVGEFKMIQCRHATVIKEDGVELSRSFSRHVVSPDSDTANEPLEVRQLASLLHTQEVKDAYAAFLLTDKL